MKPIFSKIRVLGTAALALFLTASCSDILDEQPRSSYDPTFFMAGITCTFGKYHRERNIVHNWRGRFERSFRI